MKVKAGTSKKEAKVSVKRSSEQEAAVPVELSTAVTVDAANLFENAPPSGAAFIASAVAATQGGIMVAAPLSAVEDENESMNDDAKHILEMKKKTKVAPAPAGDAEVKAMLRGSGQPICLFGEGPFERRERLRALIAENGPRLTTTVVLKTTTQAEFDENALTQLFYSEGTIDLKSARMAIADYSLPRSVKRLKRERQILISCDPLEMEDRKLAFLQSLENSIDLTSSQVGDQRPLTVGRFSPDGRSFATGSWNSTVALWNTSNCEARMSLDGHMSRVHSIAWRPLSADGDHSSAEAMADEPSNTCDLATGSADATVMLWSQNSKTALRILKGHEDRVNRIAFHPSRHFLVSTSHDDTWRLWDIATGQELLAQEGHAAAPYACKVHADGSLVIVGDLCGHALVWDLRSGKKVMDLLGHVKQVVSIDCNPQIPQQVATASDDNSIRIWDLRKNLNTVTLLAHDKLVTDCVFEPVYGRYLLSASHDCKVKLWQPTEWKCFKTLIGHDTRITSVDISTDRTLIGTTGFDRTWKLWKIKPECPDSYVDTDWLL
eukprot:Lankesteria_metandrocarpae@DN10308_c0_g1_i1.p1